MTIRGATSSRRNLTALPMRFCHSIASSVGSPSTLGSCPGGRTISAPDSSIAVVRLASAVSSAASRSTSVFSDVEAPDPGERQQVVDEHLHALGAVDGECDVLDAALVELVAVALLEQLAERRDLAQRFLQVVRGDVGELLEFGVGASQFDGLLVERAPEPLGTRRVRRRFAAACSRRRSRCRECPWAPAGDLLVEVALGDPSARRGERGERTGDRGSHHDRQQSAAIRR